MVQPDALAAEGWRDFVARCGEALPVSNQTGLPLVVPPTERQEQQDTGEFLDQLIDTLVRKERKRKRVEAVDESDDVLTSDDEDKDDDKTPSWATKLKLAPDTNERTYLLTLCVTLPLRHALRHALRVGTISFCM